MSTSSTINPLLTLDYIRNEHENKYYDRHSARYVRFIIKSCDGILNGENNDIHTR